MTSQEETKAEGQPPETLEGLQELVELQERAGAFEAASTVLQAYLDKHPDSTWVQSELCRCLLRLGQFDKANAVLQALKTAAPNAPETIALEGLQQQLNGTTDAAKTLYQQALDADPSASKQYLWAAYNLAKLHGDDGENDACEKWLDHIVEQQPEHFAAHFQRALLYSRTERPAASQQALADTINANPMMLQPYILLSELRLRDGDLHNATETLLHGLKANPLAHPLREALARLFSACGDPEAAFGVRLELCRLRGKPEDYLDLGKAALLMGSMEHAVVAFTKAINEAPNDWRGYYNLAEIHRGHGDYTGALPLYEKSIELTPTDLAYNGLALWHLEHEEGNAERALELLDLALKVHPEMPEALFNRVLALTAIQRVDDAKNALETLRNHMLADHPLAESVPQLEDAIKAASE